MRLLTYSAGPAGEARLGVRVGHRVLDVESASRVNGEPLPNSLQGLLREGRGALSRVHALSKAAQAGAGRYAAAMHEERAIRCHPPLGAAGRFVRARGGDPVAFEEGGAALVGHNGKLPRPEGAARCEPAFVFVIGRRLRGAPGDVDDHVMGISLLLDLGAAGALGPELVTLDEVPDLHDLWVTCAVNGEERLRANVSEGIARLPEILARAAQDTALEPGDLVAVALAGARAAPAMPPKAGDVVECAIEGFATLRVTVVAPQ